MNRSVLAVALAACLAALSAGAVAAYPDKPVRLIVPFPTGGPSDGAARAVGRGLSKATGQPTVIDNRPGASGAIAARGVMKATPDGYTLMWGVSSMAGLPQLMKSAPYDTMARFKPVAVVGRLTFGLYVHPSIPAKTMGEFVKFAQKNRGQLAFASATLSEYLATTQFMKATRTDMVRVPYSGSAPAMPDLITGRVQVYFCPAAIALPYAQSGRLRMLGTLLPQRSPAAPDVPTMEEAGLSAVAVPTWQAIVAPPGTPADVVSSLHRALDQAAKDGEVLQQFARLVIQPDFSTPEHLAQLIRRDEEVWRGFVREYDIPQE